MVLELVRDLKCNRRRNRRGRGAWVARARRARLAASALIPVAVLALPAAARATRECAHLSDCTPVEASSWLAVPAGSPAGPGIAGTVMFCPQAKGFEIAAGSDYLLAGSASPFKLLVDRNLLGPGYGLTSGGDAHFVAVNFDSVAVAVKPIVGCVSTPSSTQRALPPTRFSVEVRQRQLTPAEPADYTDTCAAGERLLQAVPGVLFHTQQPPSPRELSQVSVTSQVTGDRARFDVRIGPDVSATTRVTLQMTAVCRR